MNKVIVIVIMAILAGVGIKYMHTHKGSIEKAAVKSSVSTIKAIGKEGIKECKETHCIKNSEKEIKNEFLKAKTECKETHCIKKERHKIFSIAKEKMKSCKERHCIRGFFEKWKERHMKKLIENRQQE